MTRVINLGKEHIARGFVWDPDLELNPQCIDAPGTPEDIIGFIIEHPHAIKEGASCSCVITLDVPRARFMYNNKEQALWTVYNLDPLHVEPSILCSCGDHGWIRDGKWISA